MRTSAASFSYPAIQGEEARRAEFEVEFEDGLDAEGEDELETEYEDEDELEDEMEDEFEDFGLASALGGYVARGSEGELEEEFEFEFEREAENEYEGEDFLNPVGRIYRDAELMAHLSTRAAQATSESESEAFVAAMVPIASRLVPRAAAVLARTTPQLIRGVGRLGRQLRRNPATRSLLTAIPVILQRTAQSLADQSSSGRSIGPDEVLRTLTSIAARVLRQPRERRQATQAVKKFDSRYRRSRASAPRGRAPQAPRRPAARRVRRR